MEPTGLIYGLADPRTGMLRYVGQTVSPLHDRLCGHLCEVKSTHRRNHKISWVKQLLLQGFKPEIFAIEEVPISELDSTERFYISYFRFLGCDLVNMTSGGQALHKHSEETKRRISEAQKGRIFSSEHRRKLSESLLGRPMAADVKAIVIPKIVAANKRRAGQKHRPESIQKMQVARQYDAIARAIKVAQTKANWSVEFRQAFRSKISKANLGNKNCVGRVLSAETRAKMSAAKKGKPGRKFSHTTEARNNMSNGHVHPAIIIAPDGVEYHIKNLNRFCLENGLNYACMLQVSRGKHRQWQGWTIRNPRCSPFVPKLRAARPKGVFNHSAASKEQMSRLRKHPITVIGPNGTQYPTENLKRFCTEHGLAYASMNKVSSGAAAHYRGWTIHNPNKRVVSEETRQKRSSNQRHPTHLIAPDGTAHYTENLRQFCKEHGLVCQSMYSVRAGALKSHQGWTIRKEAPTVD